jgi:hypothetical protein
MEVGELPPTLTPGMLEETPEGVPNPRHPQTQDCHRKGAQGGVRGPLPKGEHFRIFKFENLWREKNLASSFRGFIIADYSLLFKRFTVDFDYKNWTEYFISRTFGIPSIQAYLRPRPLGFD